jgi:sterol desaturase/sphingolipid hydroxylase (fatty acid hydroxylase superfamily)
MSIAELISVIGHRIAVAAERDARLLGHLLVAPGSALSLPAVASALMLATSIVVLRRRPGKRWPRWRVWRRALFPRRLFRSASTRADIGFFLLNTLAGGGGVVVAMLAASQVGSWVRRGLTLALGASPEVSLPGPATAAIATAALFLAYEIAYWIDHYISHRVPFFWAFHKPHHTAEVLTPLTNFRVHPIETLKFGNIIALIVGSACGGLVWLFGGDHQYLIGDTNLLLVMFLFTLIHLQHSHFWIAATGVWGRILMSPAHHQIHHSDKPDHFDRNFGSCLAVWDWLAGTLYVPSAKRERLNFGVGATIERPQSVTGTLITPFVEAFETFSPSFGRATYSRSAGERTSAVDPFPSP